MWDWDPSQEGRTPEDTAPTLVPSIQSPSPPKNHPPQPVIVPNVQDLKQQVLQQQSLLAQMKETLCENDADRALKEKKLEMYAKKLSQIKSRSKAASKKEGSNVPYQSKSSQENLDQSQIKPSVILPLDKNAAYKGKMSELQKRLEENKIKFEERTEHGITETKKIESMVEQLRTQVQQSDASIHELKKNIDVPTVKPKATIRNSQEKPKKTYQEHPLNLSKWTQTRGLDNTDSNSRIQELEIMNAELKDTIKNQSSVIEASKRAASLLSKDLSKKEKSAGNDIETVKREVQCQYEAIEAQLRTELSERDNRLTYLDGLVNNLESQNTELSMKNSEIENKLVEVMSEKQDLEKHISELNTNCFVSVDSRSVDAGRFEEKIAELTKELEESNKIMIRLKLEHKNKLKTANKALEKIKQSSDDKGELIRSEKKIEELLSEISKLKEKITEVEDEKAAALADKEKMEESMSSKDNEIMALKSQIDDFEEEKKTLLQTVDDLNMLVDNLNTGNAIGMENFQIPGDSVSRQFDISNESVQLQIGDLVQEKHQLMEKLKSLAGAQPMELAQQQEVHKSVTVAPVETSKVEDKTKAADRKGSNNFKNKVKKLESELERTKAHVEQLTSVIKEKEKEIQVLEEKMVNLENETALTSENIDVMETQHTCLTLENKLMQKIQQCEHLRRENLELSEEKVLRTRAEEEVEAAQRLMQLVDALNARIVALEEGIAELKKSNERKDVDDFEMANIVIASKDTEIFNLESASADTSEKLEMANYELIQLQQNVENILAHHGHVEVLRELSQHTESASTRNLIDILCEKENKVMDVNNQNVAYEIQLKALSEKLKSQSSESEHVKGELHRLQVSLESTLTECKLSTQERDVKIDQLSKMLQDAQSKYQNQEILIQQRNEALLKAEETEKVLQRTWDERNELIQSRDFICQQLKQAEQTLAAIANEKEILSKKLDETKSEVDSKQLLESKQQELDSMTMKAKKLAANLKKKAQIEKDLMNQVASLTSERDAFLTKFNEENVGNQNKEEEELRWRQLKIAQDDLNNDMQKLTEENAKLLEERSALLQQLEKLNKCERDLSDLLSERKILTSELGAARNDLVAFQELTEKNQLVVKQLEELKCQVNNFEQDIIVVSSEKENLAAEIKKLRNDKLTIENIIEEEKSKSVKLNESYDALSYENSCLKQQLDSVQEKWSLELSEKESHQKELLTELNATKMLFDQQEEENSALLAGRLELLKENEQLVNQCQSLSARIASMELENSSLLKEVETLRTSCQSLALFETEKKDLSEKLSELSLEKNNLEQELKHNVDLACENDQRVNDLSNSITNLQTMLTSLQEEKLKMEEQWAAFSEKSSADVDKYLSTISQLEKQVNNFNIAFDAEVQKNNKLKTELEDSRKVAERLDEEIILSGRKKKKSVTFETEHTDYIKELRGEVAHLHKALEDSDAAVGELKAALVKENPHLNLASSTNESAPKTFDINLFEEPVTTNFFSDLSNPDPFSEESLTWDDGWGADGHLEAEHQASSQKATSESAQVTELQAEIKSLHAENESLLEEHRVLQVKYAKLIKKLKEQKLIIDRLQVNAKTKATSDSSYLDDAIIEELRGELKKAESRESEIRRELENLKLEREQHLKRIDVLNAGNERFLEMKERQDNDTSLWKTKQEELRARIVELETQAPADNPDEAQLESENRDLKNLIEGLEWKISELTEMVEEKDEELDRLGIRNQSVDSHEKEDKKEMDDDILFITTEKLSDAEHQLTLLVAENEALQAILNDQKLQKQPIGPPRGSVSTLAQLFPPNNNQQLFPAFQDFASHENKSMNSEIDQNEMAQLKQLIVTKDEEIERILIELDKERLAFENEKELLSNQLSAKEEEIERLLQMVANTEIAYNESKIEIQRLIDEERLRSDSLLQEELSMTRKSVGAEYQNLLKSRDAELALLRQSLDSSERDWDDTRVMSDETVRQLKEHLRELDASTTRDLEGKEMENRELSAECAELRELCNCREAQISRTQSELSSLSEALQAHERQYNARCSELETSQSELLAARKSLEDITSEYQQIKSQVEERERVTEATREIDSASIQVDTLMQESILKDSQIMEMKEAVAARENEIRELRSTLQSMHDEISHFRNFDTQLKEIRLQSPTQTLGESVEVDWGGNEAQDLSTLLQSDLDNALYLLHQRDVRCDELTFELTQLLEERDTLQLRLSAEIRKNAEVVSHPAIVKSAHSPQIHTVTEAEGQLAHKLSELHTIEYGRDKNIQDDTVQRYREQMDVLSREARFKANTVFDV